MLWSEFELAEKWKNKVKKTTPLHYAVSNLYVGLYKLSLHILIEQTWPWNSYNMMLRMFLESTIWVHCWLQIGFIVASTYVCS